MTAVTTPARCHFAVILLFASVVRAAMLWFTSESLGMTSMRIAASQAALPKPGRLACWAPIHLLL